MSNLRKKLIRLAYQKPHLRGDLLPLIQKQASLPPGWSGFHVDEDYESSPEEEARDAFEREGRGVSQIIPLSNPLRSIPSGLTACYYLYKTTSRPYPMWMVFGDTDRAGAARLARALFRGRTPRTRRRSDVVDVYGAPLYIGLSDGTLAKFIPPEGLG